MNGSRSRSLDALSFKSGVSTVNTSQAMGGVLSSILSSLLLLLSTPILIFGGFILVYFYHVQSFGVVSDWFYFLPYAFFSCSLLNFVASISISIFQIVPTGLCKTLFLMVLCVFLAVSCILNGISTYGCSELHSIILQQNFLSVNIGDIMDKYMSDLSFQESWDNLQRQFFCCGILNFNNGFLDWKNSFGRQNNSVPDSCCHVESLHCGSHVYDGSLPPQMIYTHGCMTIIQSKLENELTSLLLVFMVISISMMLIGLICLILSLCTANTRPEPEALSGSSSLIGQYKGHQPIFDRDPVIGQYQAHKTVPDTDHLRTDGSSEPCDWGEQRRPSRYTPLPPTMMESRRHKDRGRNRPVDLYTTQVSSEV